MSNSKITPKNLSYDASLPPFLQRLYSASSSSKAPLDGRHERAIARPRRVRDAEADKEDEPVFVDERTGEVVSAEEARALGAPGETVGDASESSRVGGYLDAGECAEQTDKGVEVEKEKEKDIGIIGASRKRRVAKVVGGHESIEDDMTIEPQEIIEKRERGTIGTGAKEKRVLGKGKGKKVKLSFRDDEG